MSIFKGSGVAIITPFHEDETVDFETLGKLIEFQIENGSDAIIICGTTGESSTLTDEEQIECVKYTVDTVNKRLPVIAGSGSNHTKHAVELSVACQKVGADAILSVTPYYNKTTQKGLISHYTQIANAVDIPVILYNVPSRTGLNLLPHTVYELSKIKNITAVKEASGNITQVAQIAHLCGDNIDIYSGNDDQVAPILALGGIGVISAASNVIPRQMHDMVISFLNGDTVKSKQLQLQYLPLIEKLFCEVNPIPVKTAVAEMFGYKPYFRAPLYAMESANLEALRSEMKSIGLI